jgi:hypothetical protein
MATIEHMFDTPPPSNALTSGHWKDGMYQKELNIGDGQLAVSILLGLRTETGETTSRFGNLRDDIGEDDFQKKFNR